MKFLKLSLVIVLLTVFGCSKESEVQPVNQQADVTFQTKGSTGILLLEWKPGMNAAEKQAVRDYYLQIKFLKTWELCETKDHETWEFNCGKNKMWCTGKESDTPVDTDDDVKRIALDLTCADID